MKNKNNLEKIIYFVIMTALALLCSYLWINSTRFDSREDSLMQNQSILEENLSTLQSLVSEKDTILNKQLNVIKVKQEELALALKEGRITKEKASEEIDKLNGLINDLKKKTIDNISQKLITLEKIKEELKFKDSLLSNVVVDDGSLLEKIKQENNALKKQVVNKKVIIDSLSNTAVYQNVLSSLQMKILNLNPANDSNKKFDPSEKMTWDKLAITATYMEVAKTARGMHNITYQYKAPDGKTQVISRKLNYKGGEHTETVYIEKSPFANGYHFVEVYDNGNRIGNVTLEK